MCLAVPAKVVQESRGGEAVVDVGGNRLAVSTVLTPDVRAGDWVLVHAGFAITTIRERDALDTWDYLRVAYPEAASEAGAVTPADGGPYTHRADGGP